MQLSIQLILEFVRAQLTVRNFMILAPTNEIVDKVNEHVLSLFLGEERLYLSSDSITKSDSNYDTNDDAFSIEFLNSMCI